MQPERIATYRLQLSPGFGFDQAASLVGYLSELGISHLYVSPVLQAAGGSTHGYDMVDPTRVNEELGGIKGFLHLHDTLRSKGMGLLLDVVANHMSIKGKENPWWWDVLENGVFSPYALHFDVDWENSGQCGPNRILLPILADHYGRVLEAGEFRLFHMRGVFTLGYREHTLPVDPASLAQLLGSAAETCASDLLRFLARSHARLPHPATDPPEPRAIVQRHRDKTVLSSMLSRLCLENRAVSAALDNETTRINEDPDALDQLIDLQNYRPAFWRKAGSDLGYRRFFDINELAGLRTEQSEVFQAVHDLPVSWVREGIVHGLRVDHPDGLRGPTEYFQRLRWACPDAWIVAEKILESDESLPAEWPVDGTTGYEFLNLVNGLFVTPGGRAPLSRFYEKFTGERTKVEALIRDCKRQVLRELLASEVSRLTTLFAEVCERHRRHRDYGRDQLHRALSETAACFPVYRTYLSPSRKAAGPRDTRRIARAVDKARTECPDLDQELFHFLARVLQGHVSGPPEFELALRFQQLTGPAMAKGFEDTFLYRFHRLTALNEVGGNPAGFGISVARFHRICRQAMARRPFSLLASTTHDTKRSEDFRARLALLSEIPGFWGAEVTRWAACNKHRRSATAPDRNTEYLLYQTLVGAWPISGERLTEYMIKAVREAKQHTSWLRPNPGYEEGLRAFIDGIMNDTSFCDMIRKFVATLEQPGRINSLAQLLLKLTAPGVPDIYQGTELWTLTLVDPDNRRPVDFDACRTALNRGRSLPVESVMAGMAEGLPKMWVMHRTLKLRKRRPELFGPQGTYRPLRPEGERSAHVVAFLRGDAAVTVVPRLTIRLNGDWKDTHMDIPDGTWSNILTGETVAGGTVRIGELLRRFPVALLELEKAHG